MTHDRRDFLRTMGAASLAVSAVVEARATKPKTTKPAHDMSGVPASWHGKEQIAMLLYPGFTALDLVGPKCISSRARWRR
jgi:cyclohexyl-isocyanide hydratase